MHEQNYDSARPTAQPSAQKPAHAAADSAPSAPAPIPAARVGKSARDISAFTRARGVNPQPSIARLFGATHWAGEWVAALCAADAAFLPHLIEQGRGYAHFLCLALLALRRRHENPLAAECARACADALRSRSQKETLRILYPQLPGGAARVLKKMRKRPLREKEYARLLHALADADLRKYLLHVKRVNKRVLKACAMMQELPRAFQVAGVLNCLVQKDKCAELPRRRGRFPSMDERFETLRALLALARRFGVEFTREQVAVETRELGCMENFSAWFGGKFSHIAYPPPPWEGDAHIQPVRSHAELKAAAAAFRNCARQYHGKQLLGYACIYLCKKRNAMIETVNDAVFGWTLGEIRAPRNADVSHAHAREIASAFQNAGIETTVQRDAVEFLDWDFSA